LAASVRAGNPQFSREVRVGKQTVQLADLGISHNQSSRWQLAAALPEARFEEYLASAGVLTTLGVVKLAKEHQRDKRRQRGPDSGSGILTGDMADLWRHVEDNSARLFLTDP